MSSRTRSASVFIVVMTVLVLAACSKAKALEKVTIPVAGKDLTVEVARTDAERERGLMGRTGLGPRDGMIFVFEKDDHLSFWMKDTPTALSIAFISAEGKILEIQDMEPFSLRVIRSRLAARYALEMRKGAFADLGIKEGDMMSLPPTFH